MKVLAIDTAGLGLNIALAVDKKEYFLTENSFKRASESLLLGIESLLEKVKISLSELDFFAVTVGPGSFTGIRIGVTTIKSFAYALNKKIMPVTRHEYLAYNVTATEKTIITDAGNGLSYVGVFNGKNELVTELEVVDSKLLDAREKEQTVFRETEDDTEKNGKRLLDFVLNKFALSNGNTLCGYNELTPVYIRKCQAEIDRSKQET